MTSAEVSYSQLEKARKKLTTFLGDNLTEAERRFVLSIARGEPEWELLEFEHLADLPAIQWKLLNVRKMDRKKRDSASEKVRGVLGL